MSGFLRKVLVRLNAPVCGKIFGALQYVSSNREVRNINTLIIGDMCPISMLKKICNLNNSVNLMLPGRSLASSKRIFNHLTTLLPPGGEVVIIDRGAKCSVTPYDYPYLSQLTRLELNLREDSRRMHFPLLYMPWKSIRLLLGLSDSNLTLVDCPDEEIVDLCNRKGYKLKYLVRK